MRGANCKKRRAEAGARTKAQRDLGMLDRDVELARKQSEGAADVPAARETRVECQGTINQRHHGADVLAEIGQHSSGVHQDARVVAGHFQGSPRESGALQTVRLPIFAPTVEKQSMTVVRGPGECGPKTRIARDRQLH